MKKFLISLSVLFVFLFTACFNEKESPLYDSEWLMINYDINNNNKEYYHQLILNQDHTAVIRVTYTDSTNIIEWKGTYKLSSKKITFNFTECNRYESGKKVGNYEAVKLIKYYTGEFFYSVAKIAEKEGEEGVYHLQLTRPEIYFYGKGLDIFGNPLDVFVKTK
jgi:hypothetical protein